MRVIFLSEDDYANFAYNQAESLKSVGVNAESFKLTQHVFGYEKQSKILSERQIDVECQNADVIIICHSSLRFLHNTKDLHKRLIVYHTGTPYRVRPDAMNDFFNPHVELTLTDQCEFMNLGAKEIIYNAAAIDLQNTPKFGHQIKLPYRVAHYPSNPEVKGTTEINEMMKHISANRCSYHHSLVKVPHEQQLKRMDDCDIYVELFKPILNGNVYGCYGVTAFEAAAAGKIVVTNNIYKDVYRKAYGYCALVIANTKEEFISEMNSIINSGPDKISELQTNTYNWLKEKHSHEANGNRLKNILGL